jgi:hypothetical protein
MGWSLPGSYRDSCKVFLVFKEAILEVAFHIISKLLKCIHIPR